MESPFFSSSRISAKGSTNVWAETPLSCPPQFFGSSGLWLPAQVVNFVQRSFSAGSIFSQIYSVRLTTVSITVVPKTYSACPIEGAAKMIASQIALMILAIEVTRLLATSARPWKTPAINSTSVHASALMPFKNTWKFRPFSKLRLDARFCTKFAAELNANSAPRLRASALSERLNATMTGVTGESMTAAPPSTTKAPTMVSSPLPIASQLRFPSPWNAGTRRFTAAAIMVRLIALPIPPFRRFIAATKITNAPPIDVRPRTTASLSISPNFATAS